MSATKTMRTDLSMYLRLHGTCAFEASHFLPLLRLAGFENGITDVLGFEGIAEIRTRAFAFGKRCQKIGDLMNESVFIPDLETGHPPVLHVRMFPIGDMDGAPTAEPAFIAIIEV